MSLVFRIFLISLPFILLVNTYELMPNQAFSLYTQRNFNLFFKCRDPPLANIERMYLSYLRETYQKIEWHKLTNTTIFTNTIRKGTCNYDEEIYRSPKADIRRNICPYSGPVINNPNRYPSLVKQLTCDCTKCFARGPRSRCEEIKIPNVVLVRSECVSGMYQWIPSIDYVTMACECIDYGLTAKVRELW